MEEWAKINNVKQSNHFVGGRNLSVRDEAVGEGVGEGVAEEMPRPWVPPQRAERSIWYHRNHPKSLMLTSSCSPATSRTKRLQVPEIWVTFPDSNVVS